MGFINKLFAWHIERHNETARTGPYHKNDNYYAEQKNFDVERSVGKK
jgi:hypothetical protein